MIALALLGLLLAQSAPASAASKWTFQAHSDPATGAHSASASTRDPSNGDRLIVRCDAGKESIVSVQFIPNPHLAAGDPRSITLTLDNAKAEINTWEMPGMGAYVADPTSAYIYASEFASAKLIQLGMLDDAGQPISASFEGPGSDAMFRQVFAACGQPYQMPTVTPTKGQ